MKNRLLVVCALLSLVVAGCRSKTALDHDRAGDEFAVKGQLAEAAVEYRSALTLEPDRAETRLKLADAFMAQGDTKGAFPQYIRAADQRPDDVEVQLKAGHLLLRAGLFKEARERARVVLQKDPKNVAGLLVLGNALAGLQSLEEAESVFERAIAVDPEMAGIYNALGVMQMASKDYDEAEVTFKRAIEANKESADAHLSLGNFYRTVNRFEDAKTSLLNALALAPRSIRVNQALAALSMQAARPADAEKYLQAVLDITKDPSAGYALSDYYLANGRADEGLKILRDLSTNANEFAKAKVRTALWQFQQKERAQARLTVEDVLKRLPLDAGALTLKSRLLLAEGQPNEALDVINSAVSSDARSADARLTKARVLLALRKPDEAEKEFQETLTLNPNSLPARLELAEFHRKRREYDTALSYIDKAIEAFPRSFPARTTRVRVLLAREDTWSKARAEIETLTQSFPKSAEVRALAGEYYLAVGDRNAARRVFVEALELGQTAEALTGLVTLDLMAGDRRAAVARLESILARSPNAPEPLMLAAKVYGLGGESGKAEEVLLRLIKVTPDNPAPYAMLGQLYFALGKTDAAIRQFEDLARTESRPVGALTMLGVLAYGKRDMVGAIAWWQKALQIDPTTPAAANNLAWLYAETETNLDTALQLAQVARNAAPENPEINDTLGWVYYKKKLSERAIEYLRRAVERDAESALLQYHLGMAYAESGEDAKARVALQKALSLDPKFAEAERAKKALSLLVF